MAESLWNRIKSAWNVFTEQEKDRTDRSWGYGYGGYGLRPDRKFYGISSERTIVGSVYNTLSVDAAAHDFRHVQLDENDQFLHERDSYLNECLSLKANIDQEAQQFKQDIVLTMIEDGVAAIVPVETTGDPILSGNYDIKNLRVASVTQWYPDRVTLNIYNEKTGQREDVTLPKHVVALVENPFYSVMNQTNSTLQRLLRKLAMLDQVDEASASGKLDLIIQLPYVIKSEARRQQANQRREDIELQLKGSKYGIAYTDGTERITQLNRPAENTLLSQVEYLTKLLYSQLGLTPEIMNGTADEQTMLNYMNRTIKPILKAIQEAMESTFLTKTARSQKQAIRFSRNPFELVPLNNVAEIADKFTRNEIMTANEIRVIVGLRPSKDPKANELRNSNMPQPEESTPIQPTGRAVQVPTPKSDPQSFMKQLTGNTKEGNAQNGV